MAIALTETHLSLDIERVEHELGLMKDSMSELTLKGGEFVPKQGGPDKGESNCSIIA